MKIRALLAGSTQNRKSKIQKGLTQIRRCGLFCACLLLLTSCQSNPIARGITIEVQRVVSGHTLEV
ncbi:MAG TPA: hypothetical protein V6C95_03920, partial [Coleofasciculaceae cyanobacterium]